MTLIPRNSLDTSLAACQRDFVRAVLPPVVIFGIAIIGLLLAFISVEGQPPYPMPIAVAALVVVFLLFQIPLFYLRRSVRRLSTKHGLICPSCGAFLGFSYATLKKTGACRACGTNITIA
jgi:hypothetical protein